MCSNVGNKQKESFQKENMRRYLPPSGATFLVVFCMMKSQRFSLFLQLFIRLISQSDLND